MWCHPTPGLFSVPLPNCRVCDAQGNPCGANPALCLAVSSLASTALTPATSLNWYAFFPSASPWTAFPQSYAGGATVTGTPAAVPGYQLTISGIFYHAPVGFCTIGTSQYWTSSATWFAPATSAYKATLPYGTSMSIGYRYAGTNQDYGCGWCVRWTQASLASL